MADTARRKPSEAGSARQPRERQRWATLPNCGHGRQFESAHQLQKQKSHPKWGAIFCIIIPSKLVNLAKNLSDEQKNYSTCSAIKLNDLERSERRIL